MASKVGADELWQIAQAGTRKLKAFERRRVIVYLDETGDNKQSTQELAKIFKVSETCIREDRKKLMVTLTGQLTPEHALDFIGQHIADINMLIAIGKRGLKTQNAGDLGETRYIDSIGKLIKERRETLENIGVIRKELGNMNVTEEHWVATVTDTGECYVGPQPTKPATE